MPSSTTPDQQRHGHDHTLAVLSDLDYALLAEERVPDVAVLRTLEDGSVLCLNREGNVGLVTMSTGEATDLSQDVEIIGLVGVHRRLAVLHRDVSGVVDSLLVSNHRVQQIAQSCPLIKSWNHSGSGGEYDAKWKPPSTLVSALEAMELLHQSLESWLTWSPIKAVLKCEYINRCLGDISSLFMEQVDDTALNHVLTGVVPALDAIFSSEELMKEMMLLEDIKAQEFINLLDEVYSCAPGDLFRRQCRNSLRKLCGQTGLLPAGSILSDEIELPMTGPSAAGGFGDVWKARCAGQIVALKTPRAFMRSSDRLSKNLCREAAVWRKLKHANIAKFLGVYRNAVQGIDLAMVSQWHDNGNVNAYLLKRPRVNRLELALDVASGLRYLHTNYLVHGDIKGANVLVDDEGRAQLTDFGLTAVMYESDAIGGLTTASFHDGSSRWMAPELYVGSVRLTPESDVYAFSMLLFEIYAGQPPFHSCRTDAQVFLMVLRGERPVRTVEATLNGLAPQTWGLMEKCWAQRPGDRPNLYDISRVLQDVYINGGVRVRSTTESESPENEADGGDVCDDDSSSEASSCSSPTGQRTCHGDSDTPANPGTALPSSSGIPSQGVPPLGTPDSDLGAGNGPNPLRVRRGFWNRRGDHLTFDMRVVLAPQHRWYPPELEDYPEPRDGYRDNFGLRVMYDARRPQVPGGTERYDSFVEYFADPSWSSGASWSTVYMHPPRSTA